MKLIPTFAPDERVMTPAHRIGRVTGTFTAKHSGQEVVEVLIPGRHKAEGYAAESLYWADRQCMCESALCSCEARCERHVTRPAPVQFLYGSAMCDECIEHYREAGYGLDE